MAKKLDFDKEKNNRNDNAIEEIMQADFPLPKQAEDAKNEAFSRIREMAAASGHTENTENIVQRLQEKSTEKSTKKSTGSSGKKSTGTVKSHKKFKTVYKTALGLTAAAAVFSAVCITNPAFAENIPLVGNVFKQLGNSLGFYGDYSKYAKQLTASAEDTLSADADGSQEGSSNSQNAQAEDQNTTENNNADKTKDDESYSKTVDGTTVTLSEVYCNEMALYLSMTIHTEDKFPDTFITSDGKPNIKLSENSTVKYDYMDEKSNLFNAYLDGKMLDDNTYAGVLRIPVEDMTVDEALPFFEAIPSIRRKIETLHDVGLSYVKLGQPSTTLSGGEAQRIKLATELSRRSTGKTVYILDEPTTGLHFGDVYRLISILHRLAESGNTVIVIEHNLDVIKTADYIIDLGPEGGDKGGTVIATGTPEKVADNPNSYTGVYIKKMLDKQK